MENYVSQAQGWVTEYTNESLRRLRALFQEQNDSMILTTNLPSSSSLGADAHADTLSGRILLRLVASPQAVYRSISKPRFRRWAGVFFCKLPRFGEIQVMLAESIWRFPHAECNPSGNLWCARWAPSCFFHAHPSPSPLRRMPTIASNKPRLECLKTAKTDRWIQGTTLCSSTFHWQVPEIFLASGACFSSPPFFGVSKAIACATM